jgi:hypothetical protein
MTHCSYDSEQYGTTVAVGDDCDDIIVFQLTSPSILIDGAGKLEYIAAYM